MQEANAQPEPIPIVTTLAESVESQGKKQITENWPALAGRPRGFD
jgi:hypothetical protein